MISYNAVKHGKLKQGHGLSERDMDQPIADMPYGTEHSHMHV